MITRITITHRAGSDCCIFVRTDNGGNQSYGPFSNLASARHIARSVVENDFDELWDPSIFKEIELPGDDEFDPVTGEVKRPPPDNDEMNPGD